MAVLKTRAGRTLIMHGGSVSVAMDRGGGVMDLGRKLAFDEVSDIVDSTFARKCIDALRAKLDPNEMGRILTILVGADLVTKEEARAVNDDVDVEANGPKEEMATDARFPHQNRLGPPINYGIPSHRRSEPSPRMTAAQEQSFYERYPNANRLK